MGIPGTRNSTLPQVLYCIVEYTENVVTENVAKEISGAGKSTSPQVLH